MIIAAAVSLSAVACGGSTGRAAAPDVPAAATGDVAAGKEIELTARGPVPRHLIAGPGDRVTWHNGTSSDQTVTMLDGTKSGVIRPGRSFTRDFPTSGTFAYKVAPGDRPGLVEINLPEPSQEPATPAPS
ncbi:hypothetical protein GCM10022224_002440 [Nonomuraea antimicrobica]|uniref:EfeO-type cupredoxin-like domain-containing protein n=1 Tax=Nonomuraea antimicrobica TaxID=561173 RepID=A0ABP7AZL7_9ACTN